MHICVIRPQWHDDVIEWTHFPRYWPFMRGIHRSPVNSPHKDQRRRAFMFSLICAWTNGLITNRDADNLRRHLAHYDITVTDLQTCIGLHSDQWSIDNWDCMTFAANLISNAITKHLMDFSVSSNVALHANNDVSNHRKFDGLFNSLFG